MGAVGGASRPTDFFGGSDGEFRNSILVKERSREANPFSRFEILFKDMRYALESLVRRPGFTPTALLTLALGIGGNTAICQLFDTVLLRSVPAQDSQEQVIVELADTSGVQGRRLLRYSPFSNPAWEQFRDSDVDFLRQTVNVKGSVWRGKVQTTKTKASTAVMSIPAQLSGILHEPGKTSVFEGSEDFLFAEEDGRPLKPDKLRKAAIYPALEQVGIPRRSRALGCHAFRTA